MPDNYKTRTEQVYAEYVVQNVRGKYHYDTDSHGNEADNQRRTCEYEPQTQ